jgi:hypothetical protein
MPYVNRAGIFSSGENIAFCRTKVIQERQVRKAHGHRKQATFSRRREGLHFNRRKGHDIKRSQSLAGLC